MTRHPTARLGAPAWHLLVALAFVGCTETEQGLVSPDLQAAKAGGGPSVTAATPAYGNRGESGKQVTITGSGFVAGDQASWERNGAADPKIQVVGTEFVSATQLVATINIAMDAEIAFYDIAILRPGRKGGIGTMLFEVTQATAIPDAIIVHAVNNAGEMVGGDYPAFVWSAITGKVSLGPYGRGQGISEDGATVAGGSGETDGGPRFATLWTRMGSTWQSIYLPRDPGATEGRVRALGSDPLTGAAAIAGGVEDYLVKAPKGSTREPRLWVRNGAAWQRIVLPGESSASAGYVNDVTINGTAVGITAANGKALIWERNSSGVWVTAVVGPAFSEAYEVNLAGTMVVGKANDAAVYWKKQLGSWTGPFQLGACRRAVAIDDQDRIVADVCPRTSRTNGPAVFAPPYSTSTMVLLGGLGSLNEAYVQGISSDGRWVVGEAPTRNQGVHGVYWKLF